MIAAVYARKSTDQGAVSDEQRSVTRQVEHARAFAASKGWTVDDSHVYVDDGISGAEFAARPGFVRLMNALKPCPPFGVLIMSEESRLGREQIEVAYALKQLVTSGVRVFCYLTGAERTLDSPVEKAMLALQSMADEMEREKARQRTYDALLSKARAGHVTGGRLFGYDNIDVLGPDGTRAHVERRINDAEAAVVRRIFELYADGYGFTSIAKLLNGEGAASPRAQQGRPHGWVSSSVREVLHRETYRGRIVWGQTRKRNAWGQVRQTARAASDHVVVEAEALRIVSEPVWLAVQARLATMRERTLRARSGQLLGRPPGTTAKYLLSGLLRCGCCGASLEARTRSHGGRRVLFYGCSAYHKKGTTVCANRLTLPATLFEDTVMSALEDRVLDADTVEAAVTQAIAVIRETDAPDRLAARQSALEGVEGELRQLTAAIASGGPLSALLEGVQTREAERARLRAEIAQLQADTTVGQLDPATLRRDLLSRLDDWRGLLRGHVTQGQQIIRRLLTGPLTCTPMPDRRYRLTGVATVGKLADGLVPLMVASPISASWNQLGRWLRAVDGLRRAA